MNKVRKKLRNNNGVSILFALFLFVVASVVSVTIISAAYSSVKRTHSAKENTQSMLTLDSASLLMKNKIDSVSYVAKKDKDGRILNGSISVSDNPFEIEIVKISKDILNNNLSVNDNTYFEIEATNLDTVKGTYEIQTTEENKSYTVVFTLKADDESKTYVKFNLERSDSTSDTKIIWTFFRIKGKKD